MNHELSPLDILKKRAEKRPSKMLVKTFSGKQFDALSPDIDKIDLMDIAHSLSKQCRFNGQTMWFYSVAQHSVHVAEILPLKYKKWGLLHDAPEAYIGDIIRPVKQHLELFMELEEVYMKIIAERFGLEWPMPEIVDVADNTILATEKRDLMNPALLEENELIVEPMPQIIKPWDPEIAKARFLQKWNEIDIQIKESRKKKTVPDEPIQRSRLLLRQKLSLDHSGTTTSFP